MKDKTKLKRWRFDHPIDFSVEAENYRAAARKYGEEVRKGKIVPPSGIGLLIRLYRSDVSRIHREGKWMYWDVKEFLKEAKIRTLSK